MKRSTRQELLECAYPLGILQALLSRIFDARAASPINTVALARCPSAHRNAELFQQFVRRHRKPLKRLSDRSSQFHRAKAHGVNESRVRSV